MQGLRTRNTLQGIDHADRQAWLQEVEDAEAATRMVGLTIIAVLIAFALLVAWAMPDIMAWIIGYPAITVGVR